MLDEHAIKMFNDMGRKVERERKWRNRLSRVAHSMAKRQKIEIQRLKAALAAYMREDD